MCISGDKHRTIAVPYYCTVHTVVLHVLSMVARETYLLNLLKRKWATRAGPSLSSDLWMEASRDLALNRPLGHTGNSVRKGLCGLKMWNESVIAISAHNNHNMTYITGNKPFFCKIPFYKSAKTITTSFAVVLLRHTHTPRGICGVLSKDQPQLKVFFIFFYSGRFQISARFQYWKIIITIIYIVGIGRGSGLISANFYFCKNVNKSTSIPVWREGNKKRQPDEIDEWQCK